MTISLLSLTKYTDSDLLSARWLDDAYGIDYEFNAVHHADGRPLARTEHSPAPALTADQLSQAQLNRHPAYELAAKGTAKQPSWANRYQKAAEIVESNGVTLTSEEAAVVVSTSGTTYAVLGKSCACKYSQLKHETCSHYLAVRMARALGLPIGGDEAARERAHAARVAAQKEAEVARIAARGENIHERNRRRARHDGDGARQWARMAMANGRTTIPAHIYDRATGK